MKKFGPRPSPALVLAFLAFSLALTGVAVAGPGALSKAISKSTVKSIARKQADKRITTRASALSVANARTAETAISANPVLFAQVGQNGAVNTANSKGITASNVSNGFVNGYYCFSGLSFSPRGGTVTIDFNAAPSDAFAELGLGAGPQCPGGTQAFIDTRNIDGTGTLPAGFFVTFYN